MGRLLITLHVFRVRMGVRWAHSFIHSFITRYTGVSHLAGVIEESHTYNWQRHTDISDILEQALGIAGWQNSRNRTLTWVI